jgi:hypothetical protein
MAKNFEKLIFGGLHEKHAVQRAGGSVSPIYIPQEQGGPVLPPSTGFPLRRLL